MAITSEDAGEFTNYTLFPGARAIDNKQEVGMH
jgi:hypothetical protein